MTRKRKKVQQPGSGKPVQRLASEMIRLGGLRRLKLRRGAMGPGFQGQGSCSLFLGSGESGTSMDSMGRGIEHVEATG